MNIDSGKLSSVNRGWERRLKPTAAEDYGTKTLKFFSILSKTVLIIFSGKGQGTGTILKELSPG